MGRPSASSPVARRRLVPAMAALICAAWIGLSPAAAQPPAETAAPPRFAFAVWPTERALPGDVLSITQDLDGYLWLGTPNGLLRFDGLEFRPWTALPNGPVHALARSSRGGIWVGYAGGGSVARVEDGRAVRYAPTDGAPPGVNAMVEDRRGTLWVASGHGLFTFSQGRWAKLGDEEGFEGQQAFTVYEDRRGRIWIGSARGLYRRDDATLRLIDAGATDVESLTEDDEGGIWVTSRDAIVRRLGHPPTPTAPGIRLPLLGWRVLRDHRGGILIATFSGGLFRVADPTGAQPVIEPVSYEHRMRGSPRALHRDRDDNLWVGMRGGLLRLSENTFRSAGPLDGLNHDGVRTAALGADGSIWVATTRALNRFAGTTRHVYPLREARALQTDASGAMWVATDDRVGRYHEGRFSVEPIPEVEASRVYALALTSDRVWLCTAFRGVLSWHDNTLTSHRQPGEGARQCYAILADRQGRVWAGFTSGGVALHERGTVTPFTERDGLAPGPVLQIIEARDGSLWFATSSGVSRFQRGRFTSITRANAPLHAIVPVLVEDEQGYVWIGIHSGSAVMRFHAREMDKVAETPAHQVAYTLFDETDGLEPGPHLWHRGVGAVRDASGRLWINNGPGMTIIDPRRLREPRPPSNPRLDGIVVNGERRPAGDEQRLPYRPTLQIDYTALSLSAATKLRFRHLLDGIDADWVYPDGDRRATYASLPAGDYRFRVSATVDGQWGEPVVWAFTVAPPFYLSGWFLVTVGLIVAGGFAGAAWLRVRAVKARYALVLAERARMSREIHDTLLQSLAALGPELEALAMRAGPADDGVATELRRVRRQVSRSVREARDSILELRRHAMGALHLSDSLTELAEATATRYGVRPAITMTGRPPELATEVDTQLFQIAREAVSNAVRHGRPTQIDITVSYDADQVTMTIADNGAGFDPNEPTAWSAEGAHFGLATMRERAEKVGGQLRIESAPGTGTTVHAVARMTSEWV